MRLVSVLGCGTWFFLIKEQLYYLSPTGEWRYEQAQGECHEAPHGALCYMVVSLRWSSATVFFPWKSNAGCQLLPKAGATQGRTLDAAGDST
jgi:hypothetical protein